MKYFSDILPQLQVVCPGKAVVVTGMHRAVIMSCGRKHRQPGGVCPDSGGPEENLRGGLGL